MRSGEQDEGSSLDPGTKALQQALEGAPHINILDLITRIVSAGIVTAVLLGVEFALDWWAGMLHLRESWGVRRILTTTNWAAVLLLWFALIREAVRWILPRVLDILLAILQFWRDLQKARRNG